MTDMCHYSWLKVTLLVVVLVGGGDGAGGGFAI